MPSTNQMPRSSEVFAAEAASLLAQFVGEHKSVAYAVLTTNDGFEVAAHPRRPLTQKLAAMSSSLQALSEAIAREAGLTKSRNLVIEAESGNIVVVGLPNSNPRMSLAVIANHSETLGHLLWAARKCCTELDVLQQRT